jgi:hypothetical protein
MSIFHHIKYVVVSGALGLGGVLGLVTLSATPALAAPQSIVVAPIHFPLPNLFPEITTSSFYYGSPEGETVEVAGTVFTPSGSVLVEEYDSSYHLVASRLVLATSGGAFEAGFAFSHLPTPAQSYHWIALDESSDLWSNWSTQLVG